MIRTRDVRVDYDGLTAVRDLDLEVAKGEIYGLIGPNGAGKTSTIRVLATLLEPTYGEVRIGGLDALEEPAGVRAMLGYMPDWAPVYDDLKVWEFLDLYASSYGLPKRDRRPRVDECVTLVNLESKYHELAGNLSRGMKQRLVLAKTLLHRPDVLLLDEPASGLDPKARIELRDVLKEIAGVGKTVLVSSHILTELADFCSSVGIMERGRLVISGSVEEIVNQMKPHRTLVMEILSGAEAALEVLQADGRVMSVSGSERLEIDFEGTEDECADLLTRVIDARVRVKAFYEHRPDLEDIFMQVGATEVS